MKILNQVCASIWILAAFIVLAAVKKVGILSRSINSIITFLLWKPLIILAHGSTTMSNETPQIAARRLAKTVIAKGYQSEALHTYANHEGQPLYWRLRLKHPQTQAKWIRPMHQKNGQRFVFGEP